MKSLKKVSILVVLGFLAFYASANESVDNVEAKSFKDKFCELVPFACAASTKGGNGGGTEPPKPD